MHHLLWNLQTNVRILSAMTIIPAVHYHSTMSSFLLPSVHRGVSRGSRRTAALTCCSSRHHSSDVDFHRDYKIILRMLESKSGSATAELDDADAGAGTPVRKPNTSQKTKQGPVTKRARSTTRKSSKNQGNEFAQSVKLSEGAPNRSIGTATSSIATCGPEVMYDLRQIDGIGEAMAERIFEEFAGETANVLNSMPMEAESKLQRVRGIASKTAKRIKEGWDAGGASRALASELLNTFKLDFTTVQRAVAMEKKGKLDLNAELDKDPYVTLLKVNPRISFECIDEFAGRRIGEEQSKSHPSRVCAAVIHELKLADSENQHTCLPWGELKKSAGKLLGCPVNDEESKQSMISSIVAFMSRDDLAPWDLMICVDSHKPQALPVNIDNWDDDVFVFLKVRWDEETTICNAVVQLVRSPRRKHWKGAATLKTLEQRLQKKYPGRFDFQGLSEGQKEAIQAALSNNIVVITGWPGSGKTHCMKFILACIMDRMGCDLSGDYSWEWHRNADVGVCAPTGRAASNLKEKLDLPVDPKTIHRLLQTHYGFANRNDEEGWEGRDFFKYNRHNQMHHSFFGIDEVSMIDTSLFASTLEAIMPGSGVCLVGDPNQLPSVGSGQVLQDIIDSGIVPVLELRKIYRQAENSAIAASAHAFLRGGMPSFKKVALDDFNDFPKNLGSDCVWLEVPDGMRAEMEVQELVLDVIRRINRPESVQVMSCTKKGDPGTVRFNSLLQDLLNPPNPSKKEGRFQMLDHGFVTARQSDKVIHCKNDHRQNVFNGDMGEVKAVHPEVVEVMFPGRQENVKYSRVALDKYLQPAWALTVHRSQGAEFRIVVMPVVPGKANNSKKMFYTAMTRAARQLVIIGTKDGLNECVTTGTKARNSGIKAKLDRLRKEYDLPIIPARVFE